MLERGSTFLSLLRQLGPRWLVFRVSYALRLRSGMLERRMPRFDWSERPLRTWLKDGIPSTPKAYADWRKDHSPKFLFPPDPKFPQNPAWDPQTAVTEAERLLNGELRYFSHDLQPAGFPPDWLRDPVSGARLAADRHWTSYSDEGENDIKFIWEPSRFGMTFVLIRARAASGDDRFARTFWDLVRSWRESNPPNCGPNWMDGQEAALRLMAWTFGFYAFQDCAASEDLAGLVELIAAHAERIFHNTDFAIFTRGNHAVSEALGLWLAGLLFPEINGSEKYLEFGRRSLEREIAQQFFADGSYSMYSLNYQRFVLHAGLLALRLADLHQAPFSDPMRAALSRSLDQLSQLVEAENGRMPAFGSNDGALVLPLNGCDFNDYRPLLQLGSVLFHGVRSFASGPWDEDLFWFFGAQALSAPVVPLEQKDVHYPDGGLTVLRGDGSKVVLRCVDFRERPSHADQLHLDLWLRGQEIACDAGTYLYSGGGEWKNGLARSAVHNTVGVDGRDQMKRVSRFTWTHWARGRVLQDRDGWWIGTHDGYKPVTHQRAVHPLEGDRWLVLDRLADAHVHHYSLHWLLADLPYELEKNSLILRLDPTNLKIQTGLLEGSGEFSIVRASENSTRGWRSRYYGHKEPALSIQLETDAARACFWTYFGFEGDEVRFAGESLWINGREIETGLPIFTDSPA